MFYLNEVLKLFKNNLLTTLSLFVLTLSLIITSTNFSTFEKKITNVLPKVENAHYFNALIENKVNVNSIRRKIKDLPGVKETVILSDKKRNVEISKLNSALKMTEEELNELSNVTTLKVVLNKEVSANSIKLIREYMTRLSGKGNIVLGTVKQRISNEASFKQVFNKVKTWPIQSLIAFFSVVWMIFFVAVRKNVMQQAYIVENFQRRTNVAFKTLATFFGLSVVLASVGSVIVNAPNIYTLVAVSLLISLFSFTVIGNKSWVNA